MRKKPTIPGTCKGCGKPFQAPSWRPERKFCTRPCWDQFRTDFMRHVDATAGPDACWLWRGADDGRGQYGRASIKGRTYGAHVAVYEKLIGPLPEGTEIDHLCRNPACVNPRHLEPVTRRENVLRQPKVIAARTASRCPHGHLWTPENTYRNPHGSRVCRACTRIYQRRYRERKCHARQDHRTRT